MKNKKKVLKVYLSNKLFYTLIAVIAVLLIGTGVYARVTSGSIPDPGHNIQSVGAPNGCDPGEYLKYINDQGCSSQSIPGVPFSSTGPCWVCATPSGGVSCDDCQYSIQDITPPAACENTGKLLYHDDGRWNCGSIHSSYARDVEIVYADSGSTCDINYYVSANCPSGKKVIGGGCMSGSMGRYIRSSYPSSNSLSWHCAFGGVTTGRCDAYAICANY